MNRYRILGLIIIAAHGVLAVWHLFLAAKVLPAPENTVSWLAVALASTLHLAVLVVWWLATERPASIVL